MFSLIKRFIFANFRLKKLSTFSALLSISVIIFCLVVVFTTDFIFYTNDPGYKLVKSVDTTDRNYEVSSLLNNFIEFSNKSFESDFGTQINWKMNMHNSSFLSNSSGLKTPIDWSERLWFLTNGSLRLSPLEASQLALWPEESTDPNDDRIINQLMYIPIDYNKTAPLKNIYLSTKDVDWKISLGRREFLKCPVSSCQLVPRVRAKNADLIFFKSGFDYNYFLNERNPNQIWAKFEIESPLNVVMIAPEDSINWTITYRHDSDISVPYYKFYPYEKRTKSNRTHNYAANKTRKVAWFVSNCYASNDRLEYATELGKHIQVDIYGRCGPFECPKSDNSSVCWDLLDNDYKFYLSFENSNCFDYITEKFWFNGLMHNILPIVMGAHPSTYKQLAPLHSYIHVDDFESPQHLAAYLKFLDSNDKLYNKYFDWKGRGQIKQIYMWCRICALLHAPQHHKFYHDLNEWWNSNTCVAKSWTHMKI